MTEDPQSFSTASSNSRLASRESGGEGWTGSGDVGREWCRACDQFSSETAIAWDGGAWTYAELGEAVEALARRLSADGAKAGDRVGVSMRERRFWPLAMLAAARAGLVYVPLDLSVPQPRLRAMVADAGLTRIISDDEQVARGFSCDWTPVEAREASHPAFETTRSDVFAILYTSGSTGVPKGVMIDHAGVINEVVALGRMLDFGPGDRLMQFSSPGFDASLEEILSCLLCGATLVPRSNSAMEDFSSFTAHVEAEAITILDLPTAFLSAWCGSMVEADLKIPGKVRVAVTGGERLSAQALSDWQASGGRRLKLLNTYGPTEASIVATWQMIAGDWSEEGDPPIGVPLPGYRVRINAAESEEWGELWIGGVGVGPGYWNRPEQTEASFREVDGERWYLTGDLAKWDNQDRLVFGGRKDDQLKIRGHRIEPDEVIRLLESDARVATAHVGGVETEKGIQLGAWVKWSGEVPDDWANQLRVFLRESLSEASVPMRWARVDEFKLTERGKLDRRALPTPALAGVSSFVPPATKSEQALAAIWSSILDAPQISREDDFFDLGGSSLLALRLFGMIRSKLGVSLPMAELLRDSKLKALAAAIESDGGVSSDGIPAVIPLREGSGREPLFCIHGGDGGVIFYRELAAHLAKGVPLLTIESPELSVEGAVEVGSIEEMAGRYLKAVRRRQPKGPYHLAGYSFGGVMVYEMARLLRRDGEKIGFLGLFDTENPAKKWRKYGLRERMGVYWKAHSCFPWLSRCGLLVSRTIEGIATNLRVKAEVRAASEAGVTEPHSALRMLQVRESHGAAMDAYVPMPLDVELILFKTEAVDDKFDVAPDYGWSDVVRKLTIVDVPGEHLTMFDSENVEDLARQIDEHL